MYVVGGCNVAIEHGRYSIVCLVCRNCEQCWICMLRVVKAYPNFDFLLVCFTLGTLSKY